MYAWMHVYIYFAIIKKMFEIQIEIMGVLETAL